MILIERKLAKILKSQTAALDEAAQNLGMAETERRHAVLLGERGQLDAALKAFGLVDTLIAEAELNIGLYHTVHGDSETGKAHLLEARAAYSRLHNLGLVAQVTEYMQRMGMQP
ncbi:MAG TPA: hypothetical protein HA362_01155 [Nanoarchaeota archaeon]|nr:hypothetical protein [Nanoarchaeota archaeon]